MKRIAIGLTAAAALAVGAAVAQQPAPPIGYLGPAKWPDAAKILPPAPATGSPREGIDQATYREMRKLQGSPRWALAQNDVPTAVPKMLENFSCAMGAQLTPQNAPRLAALLSRVGLDSGQQVASVKDVFKRKRPYLIEDGPICVDKTKALADSPDYPSGHVTWGWVVGLILTELAPDRATPILVRGRAFGESRAVCGVHSWSAVEAGRTNGAALFATLHGDAKFRADLEAARAEVEAVRKSAAYAPASCAAEAQVTAKTPW
ncbi:phosphatase PAP2 family protein [Phenylobacterium sp.]|jgi:acid phosphatase (class A)|uniref:acid phosphatase n=1 Tax=Phenylobacterium sp. TaxID=1871053 RepID=UPI002F934F4B